MYFVPVNTTDNFIKFGTKDFSNVNVYILVPITAIYTAKNGLKTTVVAFSG